MSNYKRRGRKSAQDVARTPQNLAIDYNKKGKCGSCSSMYNLYRKMYNGQYNKKPFSQCKNCWAKLQKEKDSAEASEVLAEHSAITFEILSVALADGGQSNSNDNTVTSQPLTTVNHVASTTLRNK